MTARHHKPATAERWWRRARREGGRGRVRRALGRAGLLDGPRPALPPAGYPETGPTSPAARARSLLVELGPVFAAFGRFLSTRADLVPPLARQELSRIEDRSPPLDAVEISEQLARELRCACLDEHFAEVSPEALRSSLLTQTHRALLRDGGAVLVTLVRPEVETAYHRDLELLPELEPALARLTWEGADAREAVEAFQALLLRDLDLGRTASSLELLASDASLVGSFAAPEVHGRLSTSRVLTVDEIPGAPLSRWLARRTGDAEAGARLESAAGERTRRQLARRLVQCWLRQALQGRIFPVEPTLDAVWLSPDGRFAVWNGPFASLRREAQTHLQEYLIAAAADDSDLACSFLLKEMSREPASQVAALRHRIRQAVPFRDVGWGSRDDLTEVVLLHWKLARETGHRPDPPVIELLRSLAIAGEVGRACSPGHDTLSEALEVLRTELGITEIQAMLGTEPWSRNLVESMAMLATLPERLNEALALTGDGGAALKLRVVEPAGERRRKSRTAARFAALLGLTAVLLVGIRMLPAGDLEVWADRFAAIAILALGVLMLRALDRRGG